MKTHSRNLLLAGAGLSLAIALLHVAIAVAGAPGYMYFGAASLALLAEAGSPAPALITLALAGIFLIFGLYALSAAGVIRPLPLLMPVLMAIGCIYSLRGLIVILDVLRLLRGADYPLRQTVFSATALVTGLTYLAGTIQRWRYLHTQHQPQL